VAHDLSLPGLPREKVLATVVRLLEHTHIRVGNEEYVRENGSYGLTTLRNRHASVDGPIVGFHFRGKSGRRHAVGIRDRRLARIVGRCQALPGQHLFEYIDDEGAIQSVNSADVNAYLREITGEDFTAKEFRTWAGTVLAALALHSAGGFDSDTQARTNISRALEAVAERLGNTTAVCRKCYVHPAVLDGYLRGSLRLDLPSRSEEACTDATHALRPDEAALVAFLRRYADRESEAETQPERGSRRRGDFGVSDATFMPVQA
jgi:DNA topoisomerase-1